MPSSALATALKIYLARAGTTADRLATTSGVPKATIVRWLNGRTRRPQDWRALVRIAQILMLSADEVDDLLLRAGHPPRAVLVRTHTAPRDQQLWEPWQVQAHLLEEQPAGALKPVSAELLDAAYQQLAALPRSTLAPLAPLPPGSRMPLHRNPFFTGRTQELRAVIQALTAGGLGGINQAAAATGLGGMGKTQLAVELVHRYGQYFAGGVFWISFAQAADVPREMAECGTAQHLALHPQFDRLGLAQQLQLVRAAWHSPLPRLLVFDNCEDEALLREWLPTTGGCRVLVTSRRMQWSPTLPLQTLALDVLDRADSLTLLGRYRPGMADAELQRIAEQLGDLPLALHLAGCYLAQYRYSVTPGGFLSQLQRWPPLAHPALVGRPSSPTDHAAHVERTFALSYEQLDSASALDRVAGALLATMAYLAPGEAVPRRVFAAVLAPDAAPDLATAADDGLTRVLHLGLVTLDPSGAVRMHRLVHQFMRDRCPAEPSSTTIHTALLRLVAMDSDVSAVGDVRELHAHLRFVTDAALADRAPLAASLAAALGYQYWLVNQLADAQPYLERALALRQQATPPQPLDLAESYNLLGLLYQLQSRFERAQAMFEAALRVWEPEVGAADPRTIDDVNNLGYILLLRGRYAAAEDYLRRALRARYRTYGLVHPATARSLNNLGYLALKQGRYRRARRYLRLTLAIRTTLYAEPHPTTALTLLFLGDVCSVQGALDDAFAYLEQSLAMWRAVFGTEHMGIAECLYLLGRLWQMRGAYATAHEYCTAALTMTQRTLGPQTRDAALVLRQLGGIARDAQQPARALGFLEQALLLCQATVGAEHPETASSHDELGLLFLQQGDLARAERHLKRAVLLRRRWLPSTHADLGLSLFHLGLLRSRQGRHAKACRLYHLAAMCYRHELPEQHPRVRAVAAARAALPRVPGHYAHPRAGKMPLGPISRTAQPAHSRKSEPADNVGTPDVAAGAPPFLDA